MNILLIGNGFDLEHKLPTSYENFLEFCSQALHIFNSNIDFTSNDYQRHYLDNCKLDYCIKQMLLDAFDSRYKVDNAQINDWLFDTGVRTANQELNELYSCINNNAWFRYFQNHFKKEKKNWIDFESEIARIIKRLDTEKTKHMQYHNTREIDKNLEEELTAIADASGHKLFGIIHSDIAIVEFGHYLYSELEKLIRALEIYLAGFVSKIAVNSKSPDIENLKPDCVLSFNYTDTYERVYGLSILDNDQTTDTKQTEYDYIHGKALLSSSVSSCNLVLGIDEYLGNESKAVELDFLSFKKYYQRIFKSTGNKYLDWVDEIKEGYEKHLKSDHCTNACPNHTLYIFGHSLDVTDKDVLKLLICNDNVHTKIFYHRKTADDKKSLGKLIKNLVLIIGPDELIRRTGGSHRTIEFVPQTLHEDFESSV